MSTTFGNSLEQPCVDCGGHPLRAVHDRNGAGFTHYYIAPVEHEQPASKGEEWQRKDNEVFVHREMTPDELNEAQAKGFKTTDIRYTIARFYGDNAEDNAQTAVRDHRLAALVPGLVAVLRLTTTIGLYGDPKNAEARDAAHKALEMFDNAVAKEREE